nr:hypothetical protein [Bacillus sp. EB01]
MENGEQTAHHLILTKFMKKITVLLLSIGAVEIHRKIFNKNNDLIDNEFITENHAIMMYEPLLEEPSE